MKARLQFFDSEGNEMKALPPTTYRVKGTFKMVDEHSGISEDTYRKVMALMGKKGGLARAKKLSKAKRKAIATLGGLARQKKEKK